MVAEESYRQNSGGVMATQQIHVELVLGRKVFALNGVSIGRLEEIRTEVNRGNHYVTEFLVGKYAFLERLAAWRIGREVLRVLRLGRTGGYRVRWDQIDLSDSQRPQLLCDVDELMQLQQDFSE